MSEQKIRGFLGTDLNPVSSELTDPKSAGVFLIVSDETRAEIEQFVRSQLPPDAAPNYPTSHKFLNERAVNVFKFKVRKGAPWSRLDILDGAGRVQAVSCTPMDLLNRTVELICRPHKYSFISKSAVNFGERITGVSFSAVNISEVIDN